MVAVLDEGGSWWCTECAPEVRNMACAGRDQLRRGSRAWTRS